MLNELSLHGQFYCEDDFIRSLKEIGECNRVIRETGSNFYCSSQLTLKAVTNKVKFIQAIENISDKTLISSILNWLHKHGPFWEEQRQHLADDNFAYNNAVVTDTALAEAAWRVANQQNCYTVSFKPSNFGHSPLSVIWYQSEGNRSIDVQNFWDVATLTTFLKTSIKPPTTWEELIQQCIKDYPHLTFADDLLDPLDSEPFSEVISRKVSELLSILDKLNACMLKNDEESKKERDNIMADYFSDIKKPLFKGSSSTEKNKPIFRQRMTFKKPGSTTGETIECPFHGVITHRQYRIHFSWPKKQPTDPLYVVYIGHKLTKR